MTLRRGRRGGLTRHGACTIKRLRVNDMADKPRRRIQVPVEREALALRGKA